MLFILLQFETHKADTWSSFWTFAEQYFLNRTAVRLDALFGGAEKCWLAFSIHIIPCLLLGDCYCWLVLQSAGCARACCKDENEIICIVSGCIPMFDTDWVSPSPPLLSSFIGCVLSQGSWICQGYQFYLRPLGLITYSKMAAVLEMAWVPVCHPSNYNQFQGVELPSVSLFLPKCTLDTSHGYISGGKKHAVGSQSCTRVFESLLNIVPYLLGEL